SSSFTSLLEAALEALDNATLPSTCWILAAFGIALASAVRSCFTHQPTPTPATIAQITATIVMCGHNFTLVEFITALPNSCSHFLVCPVFWQALCPIYRIILVKCG